MKRLAVVSLGCALMFAGGCATQQARRAQNRQEVKVSTVAESTGATSYGISRRPQGGELALNTSDTVESKSLTRNRRYDRLSGTESRRVDSVATDREAADTTRNEAIDRKIVTRERLILQPAWRDRINTSDRIEYLRLAETRLQQYDKFATDLKSNAKSSSGEQSQRLNNVASRLDAKLKDAREDLRELKTSDSRDFEKNRADLDKDLEELHKIANNANAE